MHCQPHYSQLQAQTLSTKHKSHTDLCEQTKLLIVITCSAIDGEEALRITGYNLVVDLLMGIDIIVVGHQLDDLAAGWAHFGHDRIVDGQFRQRNVVVFV